MDFALYVNHPTNRARVHRTSCAYYRNRKIPDRTKTREWTTYTTLAQAKTAMAVSGKKDTGVFCQRC